MMLASIRFAGDLSPWLVFGVAAAAALGVAWLYLRESRVVAAPYNYLLPALRASAVAMVILILAGPIWHRRITVGTLGKVVFAVDSSASMSVNDSEGDQSSPSRIERALRMLVGDAENPGFVESLSSTHDVEVARFSSGDPSTVWTSKNDDGESNQLTTITIDADGARTSLSSALSTMATQESASQETAPEESVLNRSALVILSDGRDNSGVSAMDLAAPLKAAGAEVYTIGLGSENEPTEVAIVQVVRPDSVAADGKLAGSIELTQHGVSGRDISLRIESGDGGEVIWQKTVKATTASGQSVPFELDVAKVIAGSTAAATRGVQRNTVVMDLRAVVEPVDGDTSAANNVSAFRVAASTRDRRLLVIDGSSRWEMRYIRNLFMRDPAWSVDTILYGAGTDMPRLRRGDEPGQFPRSREAMGRYDAIVMGEIPPEQLEPADANLLREFVTRGGGLVVIDGRYDRIKQIATDSLSDLIPVRFTDQPPAMIVSVAPTRIGGEQPVLNLGGEQSELEKFWTQLPAPVSAVRVEVQEGAESWADAKGVDGLKSPWLVTRLFGAGRVIYIASDETWRWRYKVADRFHARFWNQLLAAVMQPPYSAADDYVAIGTDKIEYGPGASAIVRARLQDAGGKPVGDATVDAMIIADNQVVATVPLAIDDPARGTYQGTTGPLEPGAYSVRIRASGFDAEALQATTPIWVGPGDSAEWNRISLDKNSLTQIADSGGGVYFHESSASQILDRLRPLSSGTIVESDVLVWQSFYWFWAVILLLGLEWWFRKRAGLV